MLNIKLRKICLTITLFCVNIICCSVVFAEEVNTQNETVDSNTTQDTVITTFELVNEWKATLFSRPLKRINEHIDGTKDELLDILYYVEVKPADSNTIHIVWECLFPEIPGLGKLRPYEFVYGPAEDDKLCLSFLMYFPVHSLCYFVLDPNDEIEIEDDKTTDDNSTIMHLINHDPNMTIPLSKIFGLYINTEFFSKIEKMNSVSFYDNTAIFNFSSLKNNYILSYSIVGDKPVYSAYIRNKIGYLKENNIE
ncbi:MAG: hypothetical protein JXA96_09100 [Sedimentisphaerales bacterium]|nr:hypothetical protein [Sedimentisphaerales bacterium]